MKPHTVKRLALSGLLALSVTGGTLAPVVADIAAAGGRGGLCPPKEWCPIPGRADSAASGGVLRDDSKLGGVVDGRDGAKPDVGSGSNRDGSKPEVGSGSNLDGGRGGMTGDTGN